MITEKGVLMTAKLNGITLEQLTFDAAQKRTDLQPAAAPLVIVRRNWEHRSVLAEQNKSDLLLLLPEDPIPPKSVAYVVGTRLQILTTTLVFGKETGGLNVDQYFAVQFYRKK
ncbi:MAG: hypothetical protein Q8L34_03430 [Candidatus Woesearchaeota archaeon]|nr:hypothetical protein [Candidatus Woesearchaeota archaeon]